MSEPLEARERRPTPRIPGYLIQGVLGSGATSVVYRAVQLSIERTVALKVLHSQALRSARAVRRLQREARTAARLKHPNIISAIDMGRAGDTWWFAMELVEGDSLAELLDRGGRFTERRALDTFIPLCGALQYASEHGVVHRDVKPANILIEADGRPRLVDLGLARVEDDPLLTRTGATLGTPHYISPEQARDPAGADVRSDIWSIGASLYHCVCGRPPFEGASAAEILSAVLYGRIPDPRKIRPDLSRGLSLVLRKCLSRDPEKRYFTPRELEEDLLRVRERKAPAVKPTQLEPLDPRARRTNRRALAVAGGLVAMLAAGIAWRSWRDEEPAPQVTGRAPWLELIALQAAIEGGELTLAAAWAQQQALCAVPRAGYERDCDALGSALLDELDGALLGVWREIELEIERLRAARDFDAWRELLDAGVAARLRAATGFEPDALPARFASTSGPRLADWSDELERARAAALTSVAQQVALHRETVWPRLAEMVRNGAWDEARTRVASTVPELCAAAGADVRGLSDEELARALAEELGRFETRRLELEAEWRALDSELSAWIEERSRELELDLKDLKARRSGASELLARELERRLTQRGLDLHQLPATFDALFKARFELRFDGLRRLEDELLEAAAESRLAALDEEARPLRLARRYEDLLALWSEHESESVLEPRRHSLELRREEARALARFLESAALWLAGRDGKEESLRVNTLSRTGKLRLGPGAVPDGFQLEYAQGRTDEFCMRRQGDGAGGANLIAWQDLERFAVEGSAEIAADELALRRVLFRFSEGEYKGARELLDASELDDDDYLVYDVRRRLSRALHDAADEREGRRERARHVFQALTSRQVEGDPVKALEKVDDLIAEYGEVLDASELGTLRTLRNDLKRGPAPATSADFEAIFGTGEVRFDGAEVVLGFRFDAEEAGVWSRGEWQFDGAGWIRAGRVTTLEELERKPAPSLSLRTPFDPERAPVVVELRFFQPADSPTDLFVLSACGYHFAVARGRDGGAPIGVLGAGELGQVVGAAREGRGRALAPLAPGAEHVLRLELDRRRTQANAWIDGEPAATPTFARPGPAGRESVAFRSLEPLRLLSATVRGGRR